MCADLRVELKSRGPITLGLKVDLVWRVQISLEGERNNFADDDADGAEDTGDLPEENEGPECDDGGGGVVSLGGGGS